MSYPEDPRSAQGSSGSNNPGPDMLSAGPAWSYRARALLVSGAVLVVGVLLVVGHNHHYSDLGDARERSTPASPATASGTPASRSTPSPPGATVPSGQTVAAGPPAVQRPLVNGFASCIFVKAVIGGTISTEIRNQLPDPVTIVSVTVPAQRDITVDATAIGQHPAHHPDCPRVADLHRPAGYRFGAGTGWVAIHLTREPRCGVTFGFTAVITYLDHGHRRRFTTALGGMSTGC